MKNYLKKVLATFLKGVLPYKIFKMKNSENKSEWEYVRMRLSYFEWRKPDNNNPLLSNVIKKQFSLISPSERS